uniref:Uncharacterized protein n=1 Tax=Cryptomonas curvata TaxID=233186 RepID=A0A7S0LTY4_9CRYP|mmetsp:Transcript_10463/g.22339  ORF Transcript_10463/g.22339 Transcript_10463/m.22339 type:complete len:182 (+) Transcript_10463:495-1040(+)
MINREPILFFNAISGHYVVNEPNGVDYTLFQEAIPQAFPKSEAAEEKIRKSFVAGDFLSVVKKSGTPCEVGGQKLRAVHVVGRMELPVAFSPHMPVKRWTALKVAKGGYFNHYNEKVEIQDDEVASKFIILALFAADDKDFPVWKFSSDIVKQRIVRRRSAAKSARKDVPPPPPATPQLEH